MAMGYRPGPSRHLLRLNVPAFDAFMSGRCKITLADIAAYLEVGSGSVWRARQGMPLSAEFVAALTKKLHDTDRLQNLLVADVRQSAAA